MKLTKRTPFIARKTKRALFTNLLGYGIFVTSYVYLYLRFPDLPSTIRVRSVLENSEPINWKIVYLLYVPLTFSECLFSIFWNINRTCTFIRSILACIITKLIIKEGHRMIKNNLFMFVSFIMNKMLQMSQSIRRCAAFGWHYIFY